MRDGSTLVKAFRSNDTLQKPDLEEKTMRFSYQQGEEYVFIDDNYEHVTLSAAALGDARFFLAEDIQVRVLFHNGQPVEVTPPTFVEKEILETDPGFRGNTATNVLKPAKINGGFELQVPLFVNPGDIVRIDTRTGEYVDRVMKK
jgi:elongation factor P